MIGYVRRCLVQPFPTAANDNSTDRSDGKKFDRAFLGMKSYA